MSVKETMFNTQSESAADRAEWMAYMSQMHYEAMQAAIQDGWSIEEADEVVDRYLNKY